MLLKGLLIIILYIEKTLIISTFPPKPDGPQEKKLNN